MVVLQNNILKDYITKECSLDQMFRLKTMCYLNSISYCFTGKTKKFIHAILIKLNVNINSLTKLNYIIIPKKTVNETRRIKSSKNTLRIEKAMAEKQSQRDKIKVERITISRFNSEDENEASDLTQCFNIYKYIRYNFSIILYLYVKTLR